MSDRLRTILNDPDYVTFVAEIDNALIDITGAFLGRYYEKNGIYSRLVILTVPPAVRGTGICRELVAAVESWSVGKGAREVLVNSGLHRHGAHNFYQRCGHRRTGYRFVK